MTFPFKDNYFIIVLYMGVLSACMCVYVYMYVYKQCVPALRDQEMVSDLFEL